MVSEVAAILQNLENMELGSRDIIVQRRSGELKRVSEYLLRSEFGSNFEELRE